MNWEAINTGVVHGWPNWWPKPPVIPCSKLFVLLYGVKCFYNKIGLKKFPDMFA